jgi:G:T/U-mismatch repair DNA glycosylase
VKLETSLITPPFPACRQAGHPWSKLQGFQGSLNKIEKIFFSSRFAEKLFNKEFKNVIKQYPDIKLVTLPSPSPRHAKLFFSDKINKYKELLPVLSS